METSKKGKGNESVYEQNTKLPTNNKLSQYVTTSAQVYVTCVGVTIEVNFWKAKQLGSCTEYSCRRFERRVN